MDEKYICTLDQASIKKAKDELNEIPEDRLSAVQAFREWIEAQPHIRCPKTDAYFLLRFLRGTKFSQIKAREKFEDYLRQRILLPKVFPDLDTADSRFVELAKANYMFVLPKPDKDGKIILMSRMEHFDKLAKKFKYDAALFWKYITVAINYVIQKESVQVNGMVYICDWHGISPGTLAKMLTKEQGMMNKMFMRCNPGRYKELHYYRAGVLVDTILSFARPFLPKKIMDRIQTHDNMETVYEYIPKELLPVEYLPDDYHGPNAGSLEEICNNFLSCITEEKFRKDLLYLSSDQFGIDESKRPSETVTQHFRKLNVD